MADNQKDELLVTILRSSAVFRLGQFVPPRETKPFYVAMLPDGDNYGCVCENLRSLPEQLAQIYNSSVKNVILQNLEREQIFKELKLADWQTVTIRHEPLTYQEYSDILSFSRNHIGFRFKEYQNKLEVSSASSDDLPDSDYSRWQDEGGQ
ncbi:MAG TPA: hypothetical protein VJH68_04275 [Candidatus Nanoarchaeia archaeon]|nr:hypothetical protein [Candidatus Nanoarchaeia archaeon]